MKMKAVVIDDEQIAIDNLNYLLSGYCPSVEVVGSFTSPVAALQRMADLDPDLLFLDIEMPRLSGFDFLDQLPVRDQQVIFITSYNQYAMKAIRYSALDYILKPIDVDELKQAVSRALERMQHSIPVKPHLEQLSHLMNGRPLVQMALPFQSGYRFMQVASVIMIEADGRYSRIYHEQGDPLFISIHLKEFEEMLTASGFYRVHHAWLINLSRMRAYHRNDGGFVEMDNGVKVPVSRRKKQSFETWLKSMLPRQGARNSQGHSS